MPGNPSKECRRAHDMMAKAQSLSFSVNAYHYHIQMHIVPLTIPGTSIQQTMGIPTVIWRLLYEILRFKKREQTEENELNSGVLLAYPVLLHPSPFSQTTVAFNSFSGFLHWRKVSSSWKLT